LKDSAIYHNLLGKVLLADRGFNNKNVQERVKTFDCQLISPNHYKVVEKTGKYFDKDWYINIYKRRWKIETIFQKMKNNYSDFKLNLKGKYTSRLKEAKFFLCIIDYNLSF
jgi:Transposase DDE domain